MFCSNLQLQNFRPTRFCDLQAAVAIAYYLIYREVPSTDYAKQIMKENPGTDLFMSNVFKELRTKFRRKFDKEICSKKNPFHLLCQILYDESEYYEAQLQQWLKDPTKKPN